MKNEEKDYPNFLEVLLIGMSVIFIIFGLSLEVNKIIKFEKVECDCSKCHSYLWHETKKNIEYFKKQGYKEPTKWLK